MVHGVWIAAWALAAALAAGSAQPPDSASVAIYYDGPATPLAEGYLDAHQIQNLLGHFGLSGEILPIASYGAGQLRRYRAAFLLGTASGTRIPPSLLADASAFDRPFCWIGRHVGQLVSTAEARRRFGFTYVDYRDDLEFREVVYKGVTLPKEDPDLNIVAVTDPGAVAVVAEAVNDEKVRRPYALRRGRFWYVADSPFSYAEEGGRYLVFCDLLHDILEIQHPPQALALARIEDVSTEIDPADLRALADTMSARKVPFQIAIIPVFRNPAKGFEVRLTDRPELADAIRYMIARGGTPVMHGATHQFDGTSGDDYEFWDEVKNRPIPGDSAAAVMRKLELGLRELQASGIHPVAFETPHYAASETDYRALKEVFSLFYERTMATPDISSIQYFPYPLTDRFGRFVVPENLGYLEAGAPDPRVLIERARHLRVVRDAVASFYFHAFLDPALLGQVTDGVAGLGYRFVSLRQYGGKVNFHDAGLEAPAEVRSPGPLERLKQWWSRLRPSRRPLGASADVAASRDALIVWDDRAAGEDADNQRSYRTVLETFGYLTRQVKPEDLRNLKPRTNTLLVVPQAAGRELNGEQQMTLVRYLASGGLVVADGRQSWLSRLGFRWMDRRLPVSRVVDVLYPEMPLVWQPEEMVERFAPPDGVEQLMVDPQSRQVLAAGGEHGAGRFLHLAVPLDSHTPVGTSHFPYFAEYVSQVFRLPGMVTSPRLEIYFDPSFRSEVSLSRLAGQWRRQGIRIVHAAAWQFLERHAFDYSGFVRLCHQNGIAVYAWFALPAVTPKFWNEHPEWRERTAAGTPGQVGWRPAMNLQNPACFRAAMDWVKRTLESYQWDGVNLSELNYDADFTDYLRADRFVPMNDDVRAEFRARAGFDPALLFDTGSPYFHKRNPRALEQFLQYREDTVTEWHRRVLKELEPIERARGREMVVTMLDSLHSSYVRPALGVDSRRIAGLMKEFGFTLQVEDPAEHWMRSPDRYFEFAAAYLKLVPDRRRLMFDLNVMPNRSVEGTSLPSALATGSELARMVMAAASVSGRAAIYSEYTVASQDWALIGAALARTARIESEGAGWKIASDVPLRIEASEEREYYVDGAFWPAVSGEGLLAPPGKYHLGFRRPWYQMLDPEDLETRLLYTSGDLLEAHARPTGIAVRYRGPGRTVLLFNKKPLTVRINGRDADVPVEESGGNWALLAPRGENLVEVETATQTGVLLNFWSWLSASAIAAFGAVSTVLMAAIYLHLRLRRAARRRTEP